MTQGKSGSLVKHFVGTQMERPGRWVPQITWEVLAHIHLALLCATDRCLMTGTWLARPLCSLRWSSGRPIFCWNGARLRAGTRNFRRALQSIWYHKRSGARVPCKLEIAQISCFHHSNFQISEISFFNINVRFIGI